MRPPPFTPSPKLTPEEKTRLAKRFRRRANLTDGGLLLGIALLLISDYPGNDLLIGLSLLMMMVFIISSALLCHRCPICGNIIRFGPNRERPGPFIRRSYECPVCNFSPDWGR